jgi:hypothetical protein
VQLCAIHGWGWITNPRRAAYNRIYNRTTVGLGKGCLVVVVALAAVAVVTVWACTPVAR